MEVGDEHVVEGGEMKRSKAKVLSVRSVDERDIYEELRLGVCWGLEVGDRKRRVKRRRGGWRRAG